MSSSSELLYNSRGAGQSVMSQNLPDLLQYYIFTSASDPDRGVTPGPEDCFDLDPKCDTIALGNACVHNDLVSRVCPVTCKICNETISRPRNTSECVDYDPDCSTLHYACGAVDLVDMLCPQTCAVCKSIH
ncbi:uncharacterized protein LOC106072209 [Biomphalaria glabrata]|uniref:Uncharacterized protein LOC106072209 n=1 Tax=Biomphalaria glabrata TaxID=6526 RepID=A0A9W3BGN0_BIOGL|nr:uncharacterized protein LOC106072209 [Biomphalaria glabrata]